MFWDEVELQQFGPIWNEYQRQSAVLIAITAIIFTAIIVTAMNMGGTSWSLTSPGV